MEVESEVPHRLTQPRTASVRTEKIDVSLAGFWIRAAAYVIDCALLGGAALVVASSVRALAPNDFQALANVVPVTAAIAWAYFALLESSPVQGTIGKLAVGLIVCDVHGDPITFRRAAVRHAMKAASSLILGAGWLMAAFTPRKQALHDLVAGTVVLRKVVHVVPVPALPSEPGEHWDGIRWVAVAPPLERS